MSASRLSLKDAPLIRDTPVVDTCPNGLLEWANRPDPTNTLENQQRWSSAIMMFDEKPFVSLSENFWDDVFKMLVEKRNQDHLKYVASHSIAAPKVPSGIAWLTLSPNPEVDEMQFVKVVNQKIKAWSHLKEVMWCFEWTKLKKIHAHAIIRHTNSEKDFKDQFVKTFHRKLQWCTIPCVDVRRPEQYDPPLEPESYYIAQKAYVRGEKYDPKKDEMIRYDIEKRKKLNLSPFYTK